MNGERNDILPSRLSLPPRANSTPTTSLPPLLLWKTKTDVKIWDFLFMYIYRNLELCWCSGALVRRRQVLSVSCFDLEVCISPCLLQRQGQQLFLLARLVRFGPQQPIQSHSGRHSAFSSKRRRLASRRAHVAYVLCENPLTHRKSPRGTRMTSGGGDPFVSFEACEGGRRK